ncbi:uncharacterized protein N7479_003905 [Penicillium vulpinum]|uniref:DDE-1 domain-containing protein n=1 Tax=Penicillium vulpinum TaxID=29845 RepID=A0A1V6RH73_9EURO|nr:uncharacterized protein N7479_003905 [Penicillium vulpinum]KAJ5964029.1 hypothetical protein N7479_003905 [Penicillium vulpinum]OQE00848.1 hypothetical protein PENVUL_c045G10017 [Penicillium vulpinum]
MGQPALSAEDENAVLQHVERWLNHGFFPYHMLAKDAANAYFHNHQGYSQNRPNLNVGWQKGFWMRHRGLADRIAKERSTLKLKGPYEDRRAWKFFQTFKDIKQRLQVFNDNIYAMEDAAFVTTMYRKASLMFVRPMNQNHKREERAFSSVIHCCSTRGKHLTPYVICRSQDPPQTKNFGDIKVSFTQSGWAEANHAVDWAKTVFEPQTRPKGRRQTWRILLISHRFRILFPEFEKFCWDNRIACICFPKNDQQFFNPMENIAFGPMQKSYTDYMRKRFSDNNENAITLDVREFASWIGGEVASSKRAEEAADTWRQSCLLPLDEFRLRNCLQGNRATAVPEDRTSILDSRLYSDETPRIARSLATSRTSVPLPIIPSMETESRYSSRDYSHPLPRESQETEERGGSYESGGGQSDSEGENFNSHQPMTPSRTPRLPKTPRAKSPETASPGSMMSSKKHRDTLDKCIEGSPQTRKRYRDDLILDRGDLEKENVRLKERVELLEQFAFKRPRLD